MLFRAIVLFALMAVPFAAGAQAPPNGPLRLAVAGLVHGHVDGFFHAIKDRNDVQIAGILETDRSLAKRYADRYGFAESLFFTDIDAMIEKTHPEAVAIFSGTFAHAALVEACARHHVDAMMEKPLAVSVEQAERIRTAAHNGGIQVIVNYETTWYRSHAAIWQLIKEQKQAGDIRKMVAMDGHQGPKEIGVGPEFLGWLTDPAMNGAGALFDFGCYGANLMTWLMDNQRPVSVTAFTQTFKPAIYPRVDDEANILIEYPGAIGIIQGSWNWPYSRKDLEVYGEHGYAVAIGGNELHTRFGDQKQEELRAPPPLPPDEQDSVSYLKAVVRGRLRPAGLSSLENNMIVIEILNAARESARTGKAVRLR
jgi:predicted dehydrogenase